MGEKYKKKIGLALGSGSARGWAHIGVLKALQENSIEIHGISGTSIGALVGAIHASGDIGAFEQFVQKLNWLKMLQYLDVTVPIHGLLSGNRIARLFSDHFGQTTIESLKIPFACIATDIEDGTEVIVDRGSIATAVRASVSIPGIFSPVRDQNRFLVDGAVSNPLPVDVCRKMGMDIVIAVNLNHQVATKNSLSAGQSIVSPSESETRILKKLARPYRQQRQHRESRHPKPSIFNVIENTIHIIERKITESNLTIHNPDILIEPDLGDFKLFDFDRGQQAISEGYRKTIAILPLLNSLMTSTN